MLKARTLIVAAAATVVLAGCTAGQIRLGQAIVGEPLTPEPIAVEQAAELTAAGVTDEIGETFLDAQYLKHLGVPRPKAPPAAANDAQQLPPMANALDPLPISNIVYAPSAGVCGGVITPSDVWAFWNGITVEHPDWGTPDGGWDAIVSINNGEGHFCPTAQNPWSTAFGPCQFLDGTWAGTGIAKTTDPYWQGVACGRYIANRYGSPDAAWAFKAANDWY